VKEEGESDMGYLTAEASTQATTGSGAGPPPHGRIWVAAPVALLAVIGVVVGVLAWAPWTPRTPVAPTEVRGSTAAVAVVVEWSPGIGGALVDEYLVLRDGAEVGAVPAGQTKYHDQGLAPGVVYRYQVVAVSETRRSAPSDQIVVRTTTPAPVGLKADPSTVSAVTLHWSRPANSPVPDSYVIVRDRDIVTTVDGKTTSYKVTGLSAGTAYVYQVSAAWGDSTSAPARLLRVKTLRYAAPLQGSWPVRLKVTTTPSGTSSLKVGERWSDTWRFTPQCVAGGCAVTIKGGITPSGFTHHPFTAMLTRSGSVYSATARAHVTHCSGADVTNTLTFRIQAGRTGDRGLWTSWSGTVVMSTPYTTVGNRYCPAESWAFSLTAAR
jgi:hypothetical protein